MRYFQILTHQLISTSYPELENDRRTVEMSFFLNVNFCKNKMFLGFAHMKKKRLCVFQEKKGDFFARLNSARLCLDRVDPAGRAKGFIERKVGRARRLNLPSKKGDKARQITVLARPTFFPFHVNGSPRFVRKCLKTWLAQGSSGIGR